MGPRSLLRIALLGWTLLLIDPAAAVACTCVGGLPLCQTIWSADAVFEATVDGIEWQDGAVHPDRGRAKERLVRLRDVRSWIGEPSNAVVTGMGTGDCGYNFMSGVVNEAGRGQLEFTAGDEPIFVIMKPFRR